MKTWLLLCAALAASSPDAGAGPAAAPRRRLLDRVVAVLDKRPLLLSELEFEARVLIVRRYGAARADEALTDADLAATLDYAIGQRLALAEAERLQVFQLEDEEVAALVKQSAERFPGPAAYRAFLQRYDATEAALAALLRRDARVERYVLSRVNVLAPLTDDDLRDYVAAHPAAFAGRAFAEVREEARALLSRERTRAAVERQLAELRSKADVRLVAPFARPPPGGPRPGAPEGAPRAWRF